MKRCFLWVGIMCLLWGCAGLDHPGKNPRDLPKGLGEEAIGDEQNAKKWATIYFRWEAKPEKEYEDKKDRSITKTGGIFRSWTISYARSVATRTLRPNRVRPIARSATQAFTLMTGSSVCLETRRIWSCHCPARSAPCAGWYREKNRNIVCIVMRSWIRVSTIADSSFGKFGTTLNLLQPMPTWYM